MPDTPSCTVDTPTHTPAVPPLPRLPLNESQSGIWYGLQLSDYPRAYLTAQAIHITEKADHRGTLNQPLLQLAIQQTLARTSVLHACFTSDTHGPYQKMTFARTPDLQLLTFRRSSPSAHWQSDALNGTIDPWQWMQQRLQRSFDITTPTMAEYALLTLEEERHECLEGECFNKHERRAENSPENPLERQWLWYISAHHLQLDAHGYALLVEQMWRYYDVLLSGNILPAAHFGRLEDVLDQERVYVHSDDFQQDQQFWHEYLKDASLATTLASRFMKAQCAPIRYLAELIVQSPFSQGEHTTPLPTLPSYLLAAIGTYLSRCTQQQDIVLNIPFMGRDRMSFRVPVSMVNTLPVRLQGSEDGTFSDWLSLTNRSLKAVKKHLRYRHEWLARELQRLPGESPLASVQVNVVLQPQGFQPEGINHQVHHLSPGPVNDLTFNIHWEGEHRPLRLMIEANPDLYAPMEVELHAKRLQAWITTLATYPEVPITQLPLRTQEESRRIAHWNTTSRFIQATDLIALFHKQVCTTPYAQALVYGEYSLNYLALHHHAETLAHALGALVPVGDYQNTPCVIAVAMPRSLALPVVLLAILRCGAAYLPLPMDQPEGRWKQMLKVAGVRYVVASPECSTQLPDDMTVLPLDDELLLTTFAATDNTHPPQNHMAASLTNSLAYVLFTSGSTGEPKGVMIEHGAIVNRLLWMQDTFRLNAGDRVLQKTPYGFDVSVWEFFWPLVSGATLVMATPDIHRDPQGLAELMCAERITTLHFVPSMLSLFLDELVLTHRALPHLRQVFASGEALKHDTVKRFEMLLGHHCQLINLYGPTEAAIDVTYWPCSIKEDNTTIPIGAPIWNTRIDIRSPQGLSQPIGIAGELYIHGQNLARGYINRPELTQKAFLIDSDGSRWYRTGDIARWNTEGEIEYLGRLDNQIKLNGQRLEPGEIEAVLMSHPGVMHAIVTVHEKRLVGYVQLDQQMDANWTSMISGYLKQWVPSFMVPSVWVALDTIPLSPNGKLNRKALPRPALPDRQPSGEINTDNPLVLTTLCTLFGEALNQPPFLPHEDLFMQGGDSLSAVRLAMSIRQQLEKEVSIATVFAASSPASMMHELARDTFEGALDHTLTLSRRDQGTLSSDTPSAPYLFCFHPAGGLSWCYAHMAQWLDEAHNIIGIQARGLHKGECLPDSFQAMALDYANTLRECQPLGPYRLMGWSLGGMLTHQIAALLQQQGESIALIAMLDTYPGDVWKNTPIPDEEISLIALLRIAGMTLPEGERLERQNIIRLLAKRQHALATLSVQTIDKIIDIVINSSRIVREAQHLTYKGDVLFFRAAEEQQSSIFTPDAWQPYVEGRIHCIDLPTDHAGIVRPDMLLEIARHINRYINQRYER